MSLTPFCEVPRTIAELTPDYWLARGWGPDEARYAAEHAAGERLYINNVYQVAVFDGGPENDLLHLSIKRIDRRLVRDWRQLQWIKNQLVGSENEAVELFPAESRLVDGADQWHLWVVKDPTFRFPFGFNERLVDDNADPARNVTQRPRRKEVRT